MGKNKAIVAANLELLGIDAQNDNLVQTTNLTANILGDQQPT